MEDVGGGGVGGEEGEEGNWAEKDKQHTVTAWPAYSGSGGDGRLLRLCLVLQKMRQQLPVQADDPS